MWIHPRCPGTSRASTCNAQRRLQQTKPQRVQRVQVWTRHEKGTTCPTINQEQIAREPAPLHRAIPPVIQPTLRILQPKQTQLNQLESRRLATLGLPRFLTLRANHRRALLVGRVAEGQTTVAGAVVVAVAARAAVSRTSRIVRTRTPKTVMALTVPATTGTARTMATTATEAARRSVAGVAVAAEVAAGVRVAAEVRATKRNR